MKPRRFQVFSRSSPRLANIKLTPVSEMFETLEEARAWAVHCYSDVCVVEFTQDRSSIVRIHEKN